MSGADEPMSDSQKRNLREREQRAQDRREEILDAAWKLFLEKGIIAVTMRQICESTSLSRATVYRYFESVEHMAYELAGRIYDRQMDRIAPGKMSLTVDTARRMIEGLIDNFQLVKDELAYQAMFDHYYPLSTTNRAFEESYFSHVQSHFDMEHLEDPLQQRLTVLMVMARGYLERLARPGTRPERESYLNSPGQLETLRDIVRRELDQLAGEQ